MKESEAEMNENKQIIAVAGFVKNRILKHENLLLLLIIIAVWVKYMNFQYTTLPTTIVLSSMAIIYFFSAFSIHDENNLTASDIFLYKISSLASVILVIGILFSLQGISESRPMTILGSLTLAASLFFLLFQKKQRPELKLFNKAFLLRMAVLVIISGLLLAKEMELI